MLIYQLRLRNDPQKEKEVNIMKEGLHPNYQQTTIRCACGNVIETGSTKKDIRVEVCSKCHPFYTGTQKMVDTAVNTTTTFTSLHPHISKWWWMGAILNTRLPWVSLK